MLSIKCVQVLQTIKSCIFKNLGKRVTALAVMILITVSSVVTVMAATKDVQLTYNGKSYTLQSTSSETEAILKQAQAQYADIKIGKNDRITRSDGTGDTAVFITVQSAYDMTVQADDTTRAVRAYYGDSIAELLKKTDVKLDQNDTVSPAQTEKVTDKGAVKVTRRYSITVVADGKTQELLAPAGTVKETLKNSGITLGKDDIISANSEERICDGMKITVSRVAYKQVTEEKTIEFQTVVKQDNSMARGQSKIEVTGENGSQSVTKQQKIVDGRLAEETVLTTKVIKQPVSQVKTVGTKKRSSAAILNGNGMLIDQNGNTVHYSKLITGKCSAYTGGGYTSTGRKAAFGLVAVNPKIIPYGTRLYICSSNGKVVYGYATAADTGGGVMDGRIVADLYYDTYNQCKQIGLRSMNLYVLK